MESEELPSDMILEILSRTSLETLDRCKTVSKDWKQMIYDPSFLLLHCQRSRCVLGYLFQDVRHNKYLSTLVTACSGGDDMNWSSSFDGIKIVAAGNQGILCCEKMINNDYKNYRYYVCKPATNQWQTLPNPKLRYLTAVVAIVVRKSHHLRFTIVRLSKQKHTIKYNSEVFDSETWAWEKVDAPIMSDGDFIVSKETAVTVGESVYWLTYLGHVVAFDTSRRHFQSFGLPKEVSDCELKRIGDYDRLGLTCADRERRTMKLWVVHVEQWMRKIKVDMSLVREMASPYYWPVEFCNSNLVFVTTGDGATLYNVVSHGLQKLDVPFNLRGANQIFRFRSDFEIVDLKPNYDLSLSTSKSTVRRIAKRSRKRSAPENQELCGGDVSC